MEITDSARKHGVEDADMRHAVRYPLADLAQGDDTLLLLGPDRAGRLLEVVVVGLDSDDPAIIHAMPMRRKFRHLLP